jgi:hypothetical protein
MFDIDRPGLDAAEVVRRLALRDVLMSEFTRTRVRAVTHLDVDDDGIAKAADAFLAAIA